MGTKQFKLAQHPKTKKWYVVGVVGRYWMPVSSPYKRKSDAKKYLVKLPAAIKAQQKELFGV